MPDIAPVVAVPAPALAAAPAPAGAVAPTAPVAADGSAPDFLGQLKAALKTLAGVVAVLPSAPAQAAVVPAVAADVVPAAAPAASDDAAAAPRTVDQPTDDLVDLMAALGLVPVPLPVQAPVAPAPSDSATTEVESAITPATVPLTAPLPTRSPATAATPGQADPDRTVEPEGTIADTAHAAAPPVAPAMIAAPVAQHAVISTATSVSSTAATTHKTAPAASADPTAPEAATTTAVNDAAASTAPAQPVAHQPQAPATPASGATAVLPQQPGLQNGSAFGQQHGDSDHRGAHQGGHGASHGSAVTDIADDATPVADQTFAAAAVNANSVNAPSTNALTPNVHPGEVVSQIAHQADLFRLPGNRGVRIQLHPEDLGGVQVTLRYGTTGGLELHINVEHAATGSLVEAGWTQLRDALATQGISPDRLVMSITSPSGATQMDFSSNSNGSGSGSFRSDQGLASFTQGGQSGQREGTTGEDASFAPRRWTGGPDSVSSTDDSPRAATSAGASRIDYRV